MPYLLVLDLDETLIYSESTGIKQSRQQYYSDGNIEIKNIKYVEVDGYLFKVYKRPFLDIFLNYAEKYFKLAIFSRGGKKYVDSIVNQLWPNKFQFVLSGERCTHRNHTGFVSLMSEELIVKKLSKIWKTRAAKNMKLDRYNTICIDDNPKNGVLNRGNIWTICPWENNDPCDTWLLTARRILNEIVNKRPLDIRKFLENKICYFDDEHDEILDYK
jgi:carboxy-terminal domain RNA polymerase II polypeptide A small phosphatase